MKKSLLGSIAFAFLSLTCYSQQELPIGMTSNERKSMSTYQFGSQAKGIETPPTGSNIRTMAEWEEIEKLYITWVGYYDNIQSQIIDGAQEECEVVVVCTDSNDVISALNNRGIPLTNVTFIEAQYNSIWVRDYAGNTVYTDDVDGRILVDWIYNRPRPYDDAMPEIHAVDAGVPIYTTTNGPTDLVNTGGNWMVDGAGTAMASELILEENEAGNPYSVTTKTNAEIDAIVDDFMGIDRYIKMTSLPYDDIHHIDMHMKLIDEETLLIGKFPDNVSDGPQIEANIQYVLDNYNSVYGTPYKIVRVPMPPSTSGGYAGAPFGNGYYRTYANNTFVNKVLLLPTYREQYDTTGIRILEEQLPGYTIVPIDIDNGGENLIASGGGIHCITHSLGVDDPLLIRHQSLPNTIETVNDYTVNAYINHKSGISSATVYYKTSLAGSYSSVAMTSTGSNNWTADIPAQNANTTVYYYIEGNATSGKTQVRPMPAPAGYYHFDVVGNVGVEELSLEMNSIYPNPANQVTCIPVVSNGGEGSIVIYDMFGKKVQDVFKGNVPQGEKNFFFDAGKMATGIYNVVITIGGEQTSERVVVK